LSSAKGAYDELKELKDGVAEIKDSISSAIETA